MYSIIQELVLLTCTAISPAAEVHSGLPGYFIDQITLTDKLLKIDSRNLSGNVTQFEFQIHSTHFEDCPGNLMSQSTKKELAYFHSMYTQIDGRYSGFLNFEDSLGQGYRVWIECSASPNQQCTNGKDQIPTDRRN